jgi:hypothetical protein
MAIDHEFLSAPGNPVKVTMLCLSRFWRPELSEYPINFLEIYGVRSPGNFSDIGLQVFGRRHFRSKARSFDLRFGYRYVQPCRGLLQIVFAEDSPKREERLGNRIVLHIVSKFKNREEDYCGITG